MFKTIANWVIKFKYLVVSFWVILAAVMALSAPSLQDASTLDQSGFMPSDSDSVKADALLKQYFPDDISSVSGLYLILFNQSSLSQTDMDYAESLSDWLSSGDAPAGIGEVDSVFNNPQLASRLISPDNTTMLINISLMQAAEDSRTEKIITAIHSQLADTPAGLEVFVSGEAGILNDLFAALADSIDLTTIVTIVLVSVLLLIIYRSPVASLVPLLTIGIAYLVSRGVLGYMAEAGVNIWSQLDIFIVVLIFGVGTDYCLFLMSRFREELHNNQNRWDALKTALGRIGAVISASAIALIVGLMGMSIARYQMIQTMGPSLSVTIAITLLCALTITPALASIFGGKIFWPSKFDKNQKEKQPDAPPKNKFHFWSWIGNITTKHPLPIALVIIGLLFVPYTQLSRQQVSFDTISELPQDAESVIGFNKLLEHFNIGEMMPATLVLADSNGEDLSSAAILEELADLTASLENIKGISGIQSVLQPDGTAVSGSALLAANQILGLIPDASSGNLDPADLVSDQTLASFGFIRTYLLELGQSFSWLADETAYQDCLTSINNITDILTSIRHNAQIDTQLTALTEKIRQTADALRLGYPAQAEIAFAVKAYLQESAQAYSLIADLYDYQQAMQKIDTLALLIAQSSNDGSIVSGLYSLAYSTEHLSFVIGSEGVFYFFPQSLPSDSASDNASAMLLSEISAFGQNMYLLSSTLADNGNPYFISQALMQASPDLRSLVDAFYSQDRSGIRLFLILADSPYSNEAMDTISDVKALLQQDMTEGQLSGLEYGIQGTSATSQDVRGMIEEDFTHIQMIILGGVFLVLLTLLRSIVAPIYLLLTVMLSYGATMGIITWLFQDVLGHAGISFMLPIILFTLIVALGSDYNILLVSRIREESETKPIREAVKNAISSTGGVIVACGFILGGTFAAMLTSPILTMYQLGAAVAIGIIMDTVIVRGILVPSLATIIGRWNWWPFHQKNTSSRKSEN
ncbi:MAG: MMPL family transporter [Dehalococcoides mccartyi]|uniref:MMPL family transporter n=1 Tax=Dehalococcoides mccartyi TaxID=61435 RepID=UPI0030F5D3F4